MPITAAPSAACRGEVTLQPSYFTSSLFVHTFREDFLNLIHAFHDQYVQTYPTQPFALFKSLWNDQGWTWMHFKVFDARARQSFMTVTLRLFLEKLSKTEAPLSRVVALFCIYTFYFSQPTPSVPPLFSVTHIPILIDTYTSVLTLPSTLTTVHLSPLQPHATYVLSALIKSQVFHVLPTADLYPLNPRELPREIFVQDGAEAAVELCASTSTPAAEVKKKGRPTKREKIKKAKDALMALDNWLDNGTYIYPTQGTSSYVTCAPAPMTTHILLSQPPTATRNSYRTYKSNLLDSLVPNSTSPDNTEGEKVLERANHAVLQRLKKIDEMAAEKGLEVGGEGGERTGLGRVERAVAELGSFVRRGGILGLLEGGGIGERSDHNLDTTRTACT